MVYNQIVTWTAFAILAMFVSVFLSILRAGCQRCKADGSFDSHWEEIQDHQIIKSQTLKLVSEEEGISPTWCCFSPLLPLPRQANDVKSKILQKTERKEIGSVKSGCQIIKHLVPSAHVFLRNDVTLQSLSLKQSKQKIQG